MRRRTVLTSLTLSLIAMTSASQAQLTTKQAAAPAQGSDDPSPVVMLDTSAGPITLQLDRAKAPLSVANFLKYVDDGYYDGLVFHRVIPGFMIQGGGMRDLNGGLVEKDPTYSPVKNESKNGLKHVRGALAMARTPNPNSATSQFFIDHASRPDLDSASGGYTVFGKVIDGMDVVDAIAKSRTTTKSSSMGPNDDVPIKPIVIKSAKRKAQS